MAKTILEDLPDRRRICVLLRADGQTYLEIGDFLGIGVRRVRHELEMATHDFPGILDYRRPENAGRMLRLAYLAGLADGGAAPSEMTDYLDGLMERSKWLRARMPTRETES